MHYKAWICLLEGDSHTLNCEMYFFFALRCFAYVGFMPLFPRLSFPYKIASSLLCCGVLRIRMQIDHLQIEG